MNAKVGDPPWGGPNMSWMDMTMQKTVKVAKHKSGPF